MGSWGVWVPSRRGLTPRRVWNATPRFLSPLDMNIRSCIQQVGSHDDLIKDESGMYYKLCMMQFTDEEQE